MTITVKIESTFLISYFDLPESAVSEFDYIEEDDKTSTRFFEYDGFYYDSAEFQRVTKPGDMDEWDGYYGLNYFAALLIKLSDDGDSVRVGLYSE